MTRAVFGRLFFFGLLILGSAAVALFATRTGYNVAQTAGPEGRVTCTYWLGFGLTETRHEVSPGTGDFECPLILRDIRL